MPDIALYLFDGSNLFHAGRFAHRDELVDELASFVAVRGARGVVVFDGVGEDREVGTLSVRFAPHADSMLERLAAETRGSEAVLLVTSDSAVRGTSGPPKTNRHTSGTVSSHTRAFFRIRLEAWGGGRWPGRQQPDMSEADMSSPDLWRSTEDSPPAPHGPLTLDGPAHPKRS